MSFRAHRYCTCLPRSHLQLPARGGRHPQDQSKGRSPPRVQAHPRRRRPMFGPHPKSAKGRQRGRRRTSVARHVDRCEPGLFALHRHGWGHFVGQHAAIRHPPRAEEQRQVASNFQRLATMRFSGTDDSPSSARPLPTKPSGRRPFRRMTAPRCAIAPEIRMPLEPSETRIGA